MCNYRLREWGMVPVLSGGRSRHDLHMKQPWSNYCVFLPGLWITDLPEDLPRYSVAKRGLRIADVRVHMQCLVDARLGVRPCECLDLLLGFRDLHR